PPRETCPYCGKNAGPMEKLELPNRGVVQSYTTLQMPPEGFKAPLSMALVELEHGALILCLASQQTGSSVNIGDQVEIEVDSEDRFCYRAIT
ncbi:MAG: Zn-ribbon domain-containing OB-fold protein, partial [Candidatus Thorarchaeota archaeon]